MFWENERSSAEHRCCCAAGSDCRCFSSLHFAARIIIRHLSVNVSSSNLKQGLLGLNERPGGLGTVSPLVSRLTYLGCARAAKFWASRPKRRPTIRMASIQFSCISTANAHEPQTGSGVGKSARPQRSVLDFFHQSVVRIHAIGNDSSHERCSYSVADLDVSEPILYPKLERKFGKFITYEDSPADHLKTEFGFDVLEVARGNFAPQAYRDFIGFYVAQEVLRRAFRDIYGLELEDAFTDYDRAVGSYRRAASQTIPKAFSRGRLGNDGGRVQLASMVRVDFGGSRCRGRSGNSGVR